MANSLKAGFSFLQAVEMVSREAQPPISEEFGRLTQEIALGVSISQSMESLSERIRSMDLSLMVTAVLIQREVGGSLAEILETIASVIRERVRIRGEIRTLTTQGRMTGM
jgi:tight adherence protein B